MGFGSGPKTGLDVILPPAGEKKKKKHLSQLASPRFILSVEPDQPGHSQKTHKSTREQSPPVCQQECLTL